MAINNSTIVTTKKMNRTLQTKLCESIKYFAQTERKFKS